MKEGKLGITVAIASALVASGISAFTPARADVPLAELKNQYGPELEALGEVQSVDITAGSVVVAGQKSSYPGKPCSWSTKTWSNSRKGFLQSELATCWLCLAIWAPQPQRFAS